MPYVPIKILFNYKIMSNIQSTNIKPLCSSQTILPHLVLIFKEIKCYSLVLLSEASPLSFLGAKWKLVGLLPIGEFILYHVFVFINNI